MTPPVRAKAFSHVCIAVTDAERSLAFYRDVLGFDTVFDVELEGPSMEAVTGEAGANGRMVGGLVAGTVVELLELRHQLAQLDAAGGDGGPAAGRPRTGYTNISLTVDDLDGTYDACVAAGAAPEQQPVDIGGVRMFFLRDPDGTPIEIIEYPNGASNSAELWRGPDAG